MSEQEIKHTPLPWKKSNAGNIVSCCEMEGANLIAKLPQAVLESTKAKHMSNRQFIIRACNSHYELVEALKLIRNLCEHNEIIRAVDIRKTAVEAIAKAEGE